MPDNYLFLRGLRRILHWNRSAQTAAIVALYVKCKLITVPLFSNCRSSSQGFNQAIWKSLCPLTLQPHKRPVPSRSSCPQAVREPGPSEPSPGCGHLPGLVTAPLLLPWLLTSFSMRFSSPSSGSHQQAGNLDRASQRQPPGVSQGAVWRGDACPAHKEDAGAHCCRTRAEVLGCPGGDYESGRQTHSAAWALATHDLDFQG